MSEELLRRATGELRAFGDTETNRAQVTRARVMTSLHQRRYRAGRRSAVLIPLGFVVAASTAWGAASGRMSIWAHAIERTVASIVSDGPGESRLPQSRARPRPQPLGRQTLEAPAPVEFEAPPAPVDAPAVAPSSAREPAPPEPSARPAPVEEPGLDLYRAAHHAHFTERNPEAALRSWDAYLAKAPAGRFALEARYNRALCLVRLGQTEEARRALEPFATGRFGAYRQREAGNLLQALSSE